MTPGRIVAATREQAGSPRIAASAARGWEIDRKTGNGHNHAASGTRTSAATFDGVCDMATATKRVTKKATKVSENGSAKAAANEPARASVLRPIRRQYVTFRIKGISPLIHHKWSEKHKKMMRDKHAGRKTKTREVRNPQQEGIDATHYTEEGKYGISAGAVKKALINAAHKDIGIEKTLVRKSLFVCCDDRNNVIPMDCDEPVIQEDVVTVGNNSTDLRYRPYFYRWAADITCEIDAEMLRVDDLLTLVDRAGFGVGLHEFRPEKSGDYGRFQIDSSRKVEVVDA